MKKWIITLNLLFYITFLNQWNFAESHPTSLSSDSTTPDSDGSTPVNSVDPTGTSAGQGSQSPIAESQPKSSSSATDQSSTEGTPTDTTLTNPVTSVTKVTLDLNATQSTTQFDYTDENGLVTFTPKDDHVFNKIIDGTKDVWKSKNNVNGTLVRTKTVDNKKYLAILLNNNMFKLLKEENNEWNDITSQTSDIKKLKFFGDNDTELKSSDYTVILIYLSYQYTFKPGINCTNIKYGEDDVWKHSEYTKFSKIKIFSLGLITNSFFVFNNEFESKKLDFKPTPEPEAKPETPEPVTPTPEPTPTTPDETKPETEESTKPPQEPTQSTEESSTHQSTQPETPEAKESQPEAPDDTIEPKATPPTPTPTPTPTPHSQPTPSPTTVEDSTYSEDTTTQETTTSPTKVTLNLNATQSTNEFEYTNKNDVITFTTKDNHVFSKVTDGIKDIWESKNNLYATLVVTNIYDVEKYLALLLQDDTFVLFNYESGTWKDITNDRYDVSKLRYFGEDDAELSKTSYTVSIVDLSFTYLFNSGVTCKKITYSNVQLWTPADYTNFSEIKSLQLDLPNNKFLITNLQDLTKEVSTKVTLNINKTESTDQFHYSKDGNFRTYTPKPNLTIEKIVKKDLEIWTAKPNDNAIKTVLMGSGKDEKHLSILLKSGNFVLLRKCGKGQPWEDITSQRHDVTKLKFFGDNDLELSKTDYEVTLQGLSYTYKFNEDVNCLKITYNNNTLLWSHTDYTKFSEIKSFQLDLPKDQFSVTNTSDQTKDLTKAKRTLVSLEIKTTESTDDFDYTEQNGVITYTAKDNHLFTKVTQGTNVIWVSKDGIHCTLVMSKTVYGVKFLAMLLTNNMFILFKGSDGWHDVTSKRRDVTKLKFLDESDTQLTKTDYSVRTVFLSFIYTFNDDVVCKKIKLGDDEVWKHSDDPDYSEIKIFSIGLVSNSFYVFNNKNKSKKLDIKVSLDINASQSTDKFDISEHNSIVTYRPKSGYKLTKVCDGTKEIWQSDTDTDGASEVRIRDSDDAKYLAILLQDGTFKFFKKESDNWTSISDDTLLREHIPNFPAAKSQTQTSSITPVAPADTTKTKVTLDLNTTQSTDEFEYIDQNGLITFTPKDNHVFSKLVQGTTDIWQSKDDVYGKLVMSMTKDDGKHLVILLTNNMFTLFHESKTMSGPSPVSSMSQSSNSLVRAILSSSRLITK